jgi:hypothetical protein
MLKSKLFFFVEKYFDFPPIHNHTFYHLFQSLVHLTNVCESIIICTVFLTESALLSLKEFFRNNLNILLSFYV